MASELERALDEILSGVDELMAKRPELIRPEAQSESAPRSADTTDSTALGAESAAAPAADKTSLTADDRLIDQEALLIDRLADDPTLSELISLLSQVEGVADHPARAVASRWLTRVLTLRGVPLGDLLPAQPTLTVSPMMAKAMRRLAATGAQLLRCDATHSVWDCGFSPAPALGRLSIAASRDPAAPDRLRRLPRFPERMPIRITTADEINFSSRLPKERIVAVIDQDNSAAVTSTIFWIEHGLHVPLWCSGFVLHAGQIVPLVNPRNR